MEFLELQAQNYPDLAHHYEEFSILYQKKLWHQLTVAIESFLGVGGSSVCQRNDNFLALYREFISKFEDRLSQIRLAGIASVVGHSLSSGSDAVEFFTKILTSRDRLGKEAALCIDMDIVSAQLQLGSVKEAKVLLDDSKERLNLINSRETIVFSKYYWALSEYFKAAGPHNEYYKAALMYIAYTPIQTLADNQKYQLASSMALAAVVGEGIFNFGEVIATPILGALKGTDNQWLHDVVLALNEGRVDALDTIVEAHRALYFANPELSRNHESIKEKAMLLSLVNIAFERPSHDRIISFQDIATRTVIPVEKVEWLVIRAISMGLIKGSMDQVDQVVNIVWVQPRVLNNTQLSLLNGQIESWKENVRGAKLTVEDQAAELFV